MELAYYVNQRTDGAWCHRRIILLKGLLRFWCVFFFLLFDGFFLLKGNLRRPGSNFTAFPWQFEIIAWSLLHWSSTSQLDSGFWVMWQWIKNSKSSVLRNGLYMLPLATEGQIPIGQLILQNSRSHCVSFWLRKTPGLVSQETHGAPAALDPFCLLH